MRIEKQVSFFYANRDNKCPCGTKVRGGGILHKLLKIQQKLVPDLLELMQKRYRILKSIQLTGPVGRRTLAQMIDMTERVLRSETEFLKEQQLILVRPAGMEITDGGRELLAGLAGTIRELSGIRDMEQQLAHILGISEVKVIPGDSDEIPVVKEELGQACAEQLKKVLEDDNIIAVTGGTTMACAAEMMTHEIGSGRKLLFVPARGGVGNDVKNQANSICAKMAENTGGSHRTLYVPDQVSEEVRKSLLLDPDISGVLKLIRSANIVLHGIGDAFKMAKRRNTNDQDMRKLKKAQAAGEAFGYYFDINGNVVHKVATVGLQLEDIQQIKHVMAVAGGKSKANAIKSYMKSAPPHTVLITDEGAAKEIMKINILKEEK
jgi:central glycolytic genes regulator